MVEGQHEAEKLGVFISYSRDDLTFADQLVVTLELAGFAPTIDRVGIHGAEAWQEKLGALIREADTVVFVLSPASAASKVCAWEVEVALAMGKRIIPVLARPLGDVSAPLALAALNYIYFYAEPKRPGSGWANGMRELDKALRTDLGWLREHTRLLQRASEWEAGARAPGRLLSGADIAEAKGWVARQPRDAPAPTALQLAFIQASEAWEREQTSAREQALAERERLVREAEADRAAREAAQAEALAAAEREAAAQRRVARRTLAGLVVASLLALSAGAAGWWAWVKQGEADATRDQAVLAQSKALTFFAEQQIEKEGDPTVAVLLALEALPDAASADAVARSRKLWPDAAVKLAAARRALREVRVKPHAEPVASVAAHPNGRHVVSALMSGTVQVWELGSGRDVLAFQAHQSGISALALSPAGDRIVTTSSDMTIRFWDAATGSPRGVIETQVQVARMALSPDGLLLATGGRDAIVRIWEIASGREIRSLKGHSREISDLAWSHDGGRIVTGSQDQSIRIWDAASGQEIRVLNKSAQSVAITRDGSKVVTGDLSVRIWNPETGEELRTFQVEIASGLFADRALVALTRDGTGIVTASGELVKLWDLQSGALKHVFRGHLGNIWAIALTADGRHIVSAAADSTTRVWRIDGDVVEYPLEGSTEGGKILVSANGNTFVATSDDAPIRVWRGRGATPVALQESRGDPVSIAVSQDGTRIAAALKDGTTRIWQATTGTEVRRFEREAAPVTVVAITPDGERVLTGSGDGAVRIRSIATGLSEGELAGHDGGISGIWVSLDGTRVLTTSADARVRVWDVARGTVLHAITGTNVSASADARRIVTRSADGSLQVWDGTTGRELRVFELGSNDLVSSKVVVSADGARIAQLVSDLAGRAWTTSLVVIDVGSGDMDQLRTPLTMDDLFGSTSISFSLDGDRIISATPTRVREWTLGKFGQKLVGETQASVPRCLTPEERRRFFLAPTPPRWCLTLAKWPFDRIGGPVLALSLLASKQNEDAKVVLDGLVANDRTMAGDVDRVWARGYLARAEKDLAQARSLGQPAASSLVAAAKQWLEKAAGLGNTAAMLTIATLHEEGLGVAQDFNEARRWLEKAAAGGNAQAMLKIGDLYVQGKLGSADFGLAHTWYGRAAAAGNADAMLNIGVLYHDGKGVDRDYGIARDWFERSAAAGQPIAMANIGYLHLSGSGVDKDVARARHWFERSSAAGNLAAKSELVRLDVQELALASLFAEARSLLFTHAEELKVANALRDPNLAASAASMFGSASWYALLAGEPDKALVAAGRALELAPDLLWVETNRAHALMYLDRAAEARAVYLAHNDKPIPSNENKPWQQVIAEDFAALRKAGREHVQMREIEAALGIAK